MESLDRLQKVNDHSDQYLLDKAWQGVVQSRLLALEDTHQRQHAFKIFLEFLNLSINRLSDILLPSGVHDFADIQRGSKCAIYQIHQLRMSLKDNYSGISGNAHKSLKTFESDTCCNSIHLCLGNISRILDLIEWLIKRLWSESFFARNVTEECGGQSHDLLCAKMDRSDPWVPILQTLVQFLQKVKRLLDNDPEKGSVDSFLSMNLESKHVTSDILDSDHGNELLDIGHVQESLEDVDPVMNDDSSFKHMKSQVMKTVKEITDLLQHLLGPQGEFEPEVGYKIKSNDGEAGNDVKDYATKTFDQLRQHVDERLEHYEDVFWEILTNSSHQQNPNWLAFLQRNTDLLLNRRSLHFLLELASQEGSPSSDVVSVSEILKLCLKCLGCLPLPIFNDIHKWLWNSPKSCQILVDAGAEEYDIELNETFNKLTRCDTAKLAVQVGCLLLQRPKATLWRAIQDITQTHEAVRTLCEVLQCLPAVENFCLPVQDKTVIFEILATALHKKKWKRTEESNLLNFAVKICQPFLSPSDSEFSFEHPPIVPCEFLLKQLVLPSLTMGLEPEELISKTIEGSRQIPLERSLRLLAKMLNSCSQHIPVDILSPLLLCLCELLETFSRRNGDHFMAKDNTKDDIIIKELILENSKLVCGELERMESDNALCKDQNFQQDLLLLWENLDLFHWTTKLRVSFNLSPAASYFKEYCNECMESLPAMLQCCGSASKEEQLILWVSILHASSISEKLAERCCEVCSKVASESANNFPLSHQSLVVSLAHCLPSSTENEWGNMTVFVRGLLSNVIDIPYYSEFTSYLPVNLKGISVALSFSQMMLSVLEVTFQTSCNSESHQHIIKCYIVAIQNLLLMYQNDCHDDQSKLFLAGQIFCQACFGMTFIPLECQETLIVLTLEVLGHVEAACRSKISHWHIIQEDMLRAVDWCSSPGDQDALMKKIQELG